MPTTVFRYTPPVSNTEEIPVVISVPHCGTELPDALYNRLKSPWRDLLEDTDWLLDELYAEAPKRGMHLLSAVYSRYVVDLNRDPSGAQLYTDNRKQTGLVPLQTFAGHDIYQDRDDEPCLAEINERVQNYFFPYHTKLEGIATELCQRHGKVIIYDAHSIKRCVPQIRAEPFADFILGDDHGKTAPAQLSELARAHLEKSAFSFSYNDPFRGGYITRSFGQRRSGWYALQLERSQDIYLAERSGARPSLDLEKSRRCRDVTLGMLEGLCSIL